VLVLAFELVVQHDTPDAATLVSNLRLGISTGAIDLDVVGQFARLPETSVERLPRLSGALTPIRLEEVPTSVREHYNIVVSALQRDALQQTGRLKVIKVLLRGRLSSLLPKHLQDITDLDNAEGCDGRERLALRAVQLVGALPLAHDLALHPAGQVHMPREHATFVVSSARPFATAARSPAALLRIGAVALVVMARLVSIQHLTR
jgi:hypothetical protein